MVAPERRSQQFIAGFRRGPDQSVNFFGWRQGTGAGEFDAIMENFDHRPSAGNGKVLMDKRVGDQFTQRDFWIHRHLPAQRHFDDFTVRQNPLKIGDQAFKPDCIAFLPNQFVDGFYLVESLVADNTDAFAFQSVKFGQTARGGNRAEVGNIVSAALGLNEFLFNKPLQPRPCYPELDD